MKLAKPLCNAGRRKLPSPTELHPGGTQGDAKFALIYARVSSKKQALSGDGLNSQMTSCLSYAQSRGYTIEGIHTDDVSGSAGNRPGLNAIFVHMKSNPDKRYRIILDHINRFSRDVYLHGDLRRKVDELGGILETTTMIYGDDSSSRLVENMSVAVSDYQRVHNKEQTNSRMRSRLTNGYAVFAAPIGYVYKRLPSHSGKVLVRNEPVASVVVEILEGYASGNFETVADVLRFCRAHPLFPKSRTGKIAHQRIGQILRNPAYAGLVGSTSWSVPFRLGRHEPLISMETHQRVQERLSGICRAPKRRNLQVDFPLRGFVMCDGCGTPLTASWSTGRSSRHPYYLCRKQGCQCYGKSIRRAAIEGEFADLLSRVAPDDSVFALATEMFEELWRRRQSNAALRASALSEELARIERQIENYVERLVATNVPAAARALEEKIGKLEKERLLASERIAGAEDLQGTFEARFRTALSFLASPCKLWDSGNLENRRTVLKLTFPDLLRYKRGDGFRTPNLALPFKVLGLPVSVGVKMARPKGFEPLTLRFVV